MTEAMAQNGEQQAAMTLRMPSALSPGCSLPAAAFCDTFDTAYGGTPYGPRTPAGRTGALDPTRWSVAHMGAWNLGQGQYDSWMPSKYMFCRTPKTGLLPPHDYFFCGTTFGESEHFMEAFDDQGGYVVNDAMALQPVDLSRGTRTITFDVDAKTTGGHTWWVEVALSDQPVPAPHWGFVKTNLRPANGLNFRFDTGCKVGSAKGTTLGTVEVFRNYVGQEMPITRSPRAGSSAGCFTSMDDMRGRITAKISTNRLEIWATDFDGTHNRMIAAVDKLRLTMSRAYLHLQHGQYNAAKDRNQPFQTYHWDNVEFDGPRLTPTRSYQVPDSLVRRRQGDLNLGYKITTGEHGKAFTLRGVDLTGAKRAFFALSSDCEDAVRKCATLQYKVNGGPVHTYRFDRSVLGGGYSVRQAALPVPLAELRSGANTVTLLPVGSSPTYSEMVANLNLFVETA